MLTQGHGPVTHHPSPVAGANGQGPSDSNEVPPMTPQDKLTKFVEQL